MPTMMMAQIFLHAGKAKPFWLGEVLVFSGAIARVTGNPRVGELVSVYDHQSKLIAVGAFNPHSSYRVRLLVFAKEKIAYEWEAILRYRITQAIEKRSALSLPDQHCNVYRLLNSEGDGLSGLTVDVFGVHAVVSSTAYWVEVNRELIESLLKSLCQFEQVHWRAQVKSLHQDGWSNISDVTALTSCPLIVVENDLQYHLDLAAGQKTGFYCDQRENRVLIRDFVKGKSVYDCFCYTGGFALNAAFAGAKSVLGVDSSREAIALARKNAELNALKELDFECAKVEDFLKEAPMVDVIILDPPKLAPNHKSLGRAKHRYFQLNRLALSRLKTGGILMTFSCSNAMKQAVFLSIIKAAAKAAGKAIQIQEIRGAAKDHPVISGAQYGDYLKAVLLEVC